MTYAAELLAIQTRMQAGFTAVYPHVPVIYDNVAGTPPNNAAWVRVNVLNGDSNQISIGQGDTDKGQHRQAGLIEFQIFGPLGDGALVTREIADAIANIFRAEKLDANVQCLSPRLTTIGAREAYYQLNLSVPYQRDEVYS